MKTRLKKHLTGCQANLLSSSPTSKASARKKRPPLAHWLNPKAQKIYTNSKKLNKRYLEMGLTPSPHSNLNLFILRIPTIINRKILQNQSNLQIHWTSKKRLNKSLKTLPSPPHKKLKDKHQMRHKQSARLKQHDYRLIVSKHLQKYLHWPITTICKSTLNRKIYANSSVERILNCKAFKWDSNLRFKCSNWKTLSFQRNHTNINSWPSTQIWKPTTKYRKMNAFTAILTIKMNKWRRSFMRR